VTHPDDVATATSARLNEGQSTAGLSVSVAHGKMKRVARGCSFERRKAENRTSDGSARLTAASECWAISLGSDLERIIVSVLGYMRGSSSCSTDGVEIRMQDGGYCFHPDRPGNSCGNCITQDWQN